MTIPDVPAASSLLDDGLNDAIDRARRSISDVSVKLDSGLLTGAPTDAIATLQAARQLLETISDKIRPATLAEGDTRDALLFDVSDMFGYFPDNRLPTGVQRVQISVILSFLDAPDGRAITLTRFVEGRDEWVEIPIPQFRLVCQLSMADGDPVAADWRAAFAELEKAIAYQPAMKFPRGACLVNLGTSWWLPNYFMYVRQAKIDSDIRYIPLIHDMIPVLRPKECHPDLVHEFIDWLMGVLCHSDFFLANSEATKADLIKLAAQLDLAISPQNVAVVPLQAELAQTRCDPRDQAALLAKWGLLPGSFVLQVSTLETRKNQLGAFNAWQHLIGIHGKSRVPSLVCVGKMGYQSGDIIARRDASADLQDKVLILDRVDDAELETLYRHCLFTLYPSFYEGWGLPVTESLCYGKVPLTADNSSLPQAGAGLSVMFETGSNTALQAALDRLIYDPAYREAKEAAIARNFVPRGWTDVARDIDRSVRGFEKSETAGQSGWMPLTAHPGFYPMIRNRETKISAGIGSAEIFRYETGWWRLEDHGCSTRSNGGALSMRLPTGTKHIALELFGLPTKSTTFTIRVSGAAEQVNGSIRANSRKWVFVDVEDDFAWSERVIRLNSQFTEVVVDANSKSRELGIGLRSFFVFDPSNSRARLDFVEAVALGGLETYKQLPSLR